MHRRIVSVSPLTPASIHLATRGTPSTPFSAYSSHDADEALASASALVEWGRSTEQVEPSLTASQVGVEAMDTDE